MKVALTKPYFNKKEEKAAIEVIRSGWHTQGPKTAEFEKIFAEYTKSKYAIAVSNCTTALHLALVVGGIGTGDEVIVPSYTYIASANVIVHAGAKPVFIDVDVRTFNLDVNLLEKLITKKTKAIITIDQVGLASDIDQINNIAKKYKLLVIADAACAIGSKYKNKMVGGIADMTCFSMHPRKLISTGEGGMITTNNKTYAKNAQIWRSHGADISDIARHTTSKVILEEFIVNGFNYRITDIQSAIGIEQMKKMPIILKKRARLARRYNRLLKPVKCLSIPYVPEYAIHNWQTYIITLTNDTPISRDDLMQKLSDDGITVRRGVMACHEQPIFRKMIGKVSLPVTEKLNKRTICLPIFPGMTIAEQDYVIERLKKHLK